MPGGTARLRVSGAIARRFGSVIGPSLKGSNSLVWLMSGMFRVNDDREQLGIAAVFAMARAIRWAQTGCARVALATLAPVPVQDDLSRIGSGAAWAASRTTVRRPGHSGRQAGGWRG